MSWKGEEHDHFWYPSLETPPPPNFTPGNQYLLDALILLSQFLFQASFLFSKQLLWNHMKKEILVGLCSALIRLYISQRKDGTGNGDAGVYHTA